jgi:hypothetical protein
MLLMPTLGRGPATAGLEIAPVSSQKAAIWLFTLCIAQLSPFIMN